jgi:NADPH:quinone reductase-like Zn-dependent oxidoreductase
MKAAQISRFGGPDALSVNEVRQPIAGPGQVLVSVEAASVNGHDTAIRSGRLKLISGRSFPIGVGLDFVGTIAALGSGSIQRRELERVWGTVHPRKRHATASSAEFVVVDDTRVAPAPSGLSATDAAALVVAGTTALTALRDVLHLAGGERVLIRGAAGGVGTAAVQIAHALDGRVTALARDRYATELETLGAEQVLDHTTTGPHQLGPFEVILDLVGSDLGRYRRRLTRDGRMATVALSGAVIASATASIIHGRRRIRTFSANPTSQILNELTALADSSALRPVVNSVHPLADIAQAHAAFDRGGTLGKHVLAIAH